MYAIVSMQGFQFRVTPGETIRVPALGAEPGGEITIPDVHLIADGERIEVGHPTIEAAHVRAEVLAHGRGPKLHAAKYKRRKDYRRRWGHRTNYTELRIADIVRAAS